MTTNRKPANCTDCNRKLTSATRSDNEVLCTKCYELAALENDHQDGYHDDAPDADCLMCDPNARAQVNGHTNGKPKSHTSHADCDHDKTKAARAACRKARAAKA